MPKPVPMPSSIKVGPHVYSVLRKPSSIMKDTIGHCGFDDLQIWVKQRLRRSKSQETLLHEVLHATTHPTMNCSGEHTDEEFVAAIAPVLFQVLQENPELVEYLTR